MIDDARYLLSIVHRTTPLSPETTFLRYLLEMTMIEARRLSEDDASDLGKADEFETLRASAILILWKSGRFSHGELAALFSVPTKEVASFLNLASEHNAIALTLSAENDNLA